jgi:hypothetical protein
LERVSLQLQLVKPTRVLSAKSRAASRAAVAAARAARAARLTGRRRQRRAQAACVFTVRARARRPVPPSRPCSLPRRTLSSGNSLLENSLRGSHEDAVSLSLFQRVCARAPFARSFVPCDRTPSHLHRISSTAANSLLGRFSPRHSPWFPRGRSTRLHGRAPARARSCAPPFLAIAPGCVRVCVSAFAERRRVCSLAHADA